MGVRRKVLYPIALTTMLFSSSAMARIPSLAFVGVTEFFLKGREFYSPTLGEAGLDSAIMAGIRLYGPFEAAYDKKGVRDYSSDTSTIPLWNVAKILLPSVSGQLGTESQAETNFSRYVKDPKTAALLLNYVKKVRDAGKGDVPNKKTQQFTADILKTLTGLEGKSTTENFKKKTLNALLKYIRESIKEEINKNSLFPQYSTEQVLASWFCQHFNTGEDILKLIENLDGSIVDKTKPLPTQLKYLEKEDLPLITEKQNFNLDDFFDLSHAQSLISIIPYKEGIECAFR